MTKIRTSDSRGFSRIDVGRGLPTPPLLPNAHNHCTATPTASSSTIGIRRERTRPRKQPNLNPCGSRGLSRIDVGRASLSAVGAIPTPPSRASRSPSVPASPRLYRLAVFLSLLALVAILPAPTLAAESPDRTTVIVAVGAPGEPEYAREFAAETEAWRAAAKAGGAAFSVVGTDPSDYTSPPDRDLLKQRLDAEEKAGAGELWVVLIGHGTFDGVDAKLNLRGPDVSAPELAAWLKPFRRPVAIIDTSAASAPFLAALSAPNRVVITATRSGFEQNYARFGRYFATALSDARADLDKDGQVSLLEAFLTGARDTAEFYKTNGRLATEHPLIDDNGDALGTPADWFRGVRATKRAKDGAELDGARARQLCLIRSAAEQQLPPALRARRDQLELEIEKLRDAKANLPENDYYDRLERLMLDLAALYEST